MNLKAALEEDDNVLTQLQYTERKQRLWSSLAARKAEIGSMICYQLGVDWCHDPSMHFGDVETGSFNVAILVLLHCLYTHLAFLMDL